MIPEPEVAWLVPLCGSCGWRGVPCRTDEDIEAAPTHCPDCGERVGGEIRRGRYRQFSQARSAALRERR